MTDMTGLDPELLRTFAGHASTLSDDADGAARTARTWIAVCDLDSGVGALLDEISDESGLLRDIGRAKATEMEMAAQGRGFWASPGPLLDRLLSSLGDDVGEGVSPGESLAPWLDGRPDESWTAEEFAALADDPNVPAYVRDAVSAITGDPVVFANLERAGTLIDDSGAVTTESIVLFVATQSVSRDFGAPRVFEQFDGAVTGELDDRISLDDVEAIASDANASQELRDMAALIEENPLIFAMLDTGTTSADLDLDNSYLLQDGKISFGDVVATAVNTQAFNGRPTEAREFVSNLPSTNDHRDGSGNFLQIRWFSDSGVRELAGTALADAPTLVDQVDVVSRLPESPGGVRNLAITEYYGRLGAQIDLILNPDGEGGVLPLDAVGSTGSNWFMQGQHASAGIRPVMVDNAGYSLATAGWSARQEMADGNQLLFHSLAPAAAAFIETFPPGTVPSPEAIEEFFVNSERANGKPLFEDGDRQLRDAFALMLDASTDPNPVTRQQTTFRASLLIGIHEQALVDPFVDRALDQGWEDGYRVLGDIVDPDESMATGQIDPNLGGYQFDADRPLPVRGGHTDSVIGRDLTTTLNPVDVTRVSIDGVAYDLSGSGRGTVDLPDLQGWDEVPGDWEVDSKVIDPALWHGEHGDAPAGEGDDPKLECVPGSTTGVPLPGRSDLPGAAVDDWKDFEDRMWTIANSFQQTHTLPGMTAAPGHGFDTADLSFLPEAS